MLALKPWKYIFLRRLVDHGLSLHSQALLTYNLGSAWIKPYSKRIKEPPLGSIPLVLA